MADLPPLLQAHFRAPRNAGRLNLPSGRGEAHNQACGDHLALEIAVRDGRLAELAWEGRGCSAVLACASLGSEALTGLDLEAAERFDLEAAVRAAGGVAPRQGHALAVVLRALELALADWRRRCHPGIAPR